MDDELKDKSLGYRPDINYEDEYGSEYAGLTDRTAEPAPEIDDSLIDNSIMAETQFNIDEIVAYINGLPIDYQTAINQVFKPIFLDWYNDLRDRDFPTRIPNPTEPIITERDPWKPEPQPDPGLIGGLPDPIMPDPFVLPDPEYKPDPLPPNLYTPEIYDPILPEYVEPEPVYPPYDELEDLFAPSSPFEITYEEIDPIEQFKLEYIKNLAELYNFFTNELKHTLGKFYMTIVPALIAAKSPNQLAFVINKISQNDVGVIKDLKHLMDSSLRSEVIGGNKLSFCANMFSLESTLYHIKNFKTAYHLRLRYLEENPTDSSSNGGSMSNNILNGMSDLYNKKYDVAYTNLYKYLNSFTKVLTDVFNTIGVGYRSKETLIKKGGIQ